MTAPAERIAAATLAVTGVTGLASGTPAQLASTYLPGRRIVGVREQDGHVEIHVVADAAIASLPDLAEEIRQAVRLGHPDADEIDVHIDDLHQIIDLRDGLTPDHDPADTDVLDQTRRSPR